MAGDSDLDRFDRIFRGKAAIGEAAAGARAFGEAQWLGEEEIARLCIIVEEWFANLFDHGGLTEKEEVRLEIATDPAGIRMVITDPGQPFDPRSLSAMVEVPERGGGAGIGIIRGWARIVDYDVTSGGNRLELLLPLHWEE